MAINKKLIHFKTGEKFDEALSNNEILDTSIVFIKDRQQIYTHGQFYDCFGMSEDEINLYVEEQINTKVDKSYEVRLRGYNKSENGNYACNIIKLLNSNFIALNILTKDGITISEEYSGNGEQCLTLTPDANYLATKEDLESKANDNEVIKSIYTYNGSKITANENGTLNTSEGDVLVAKPDDNRPNYITLKVNPKGPIATRDYVDEATKNIDRTLYKVVGSIPTTPDVADKNKIFLVPSTDTEELNAYTEYIYTDEDGWEKLGEKIGIDLSEYVTKEDLEKNKPFGEIESQSYILPEQTIELDPLYQEDLGSLQETGYNLTMDVIIDNKPIVGQSYFVVIDSKEPLTVTCKELEDSDFSFILSSGDSTSFEGSDFAILVTDDYFPSVLIIMKNSLYSYLDKHTIKVYTEEIVTKKLDPKYYEQSGFELITDQNGTTPRTRLRGSLNNANGLLSVAEGTGTVSEGRYSHAEGNSSEAIGTGSHAEGYNTRANGDYSHTEGINTVTKNNYETAIGQFNVSNTSLPVQWQSFGKEWIRTQDVVSIDGFCYRHSGVLKASESHVLAGGQIDTIMRLETPILCCSIPNIIESITFNIYSLAPMYVFKNQSIHLKLETIDTELADFLKVTTTIQEYTVTPDGSNTLVEFIVYFPDAAVGQTYVSAVGITDIKYKNGIQHNGTIFTIGNGADEINRHNAVEIYDDGSIYITDTSANGEDYQKPMISLQEKLKSHDDKLEGVTKVADDSEVIKKITFGDTTFSGKLNQGTVIIGTGQGISTYYTGPSDNPIGVNISLDTDFIATREYVNEAFENILLVDNEYETPLSEVQTLSFTDGLSVNNEGDGIVTIEVDTNYLVTKEDLNTLKSTIEQLKSEITELKSQLNNKLDASQLQTMTQEEYDSAEKDENTYYFIKEEA